MGESIKIGHAPKTVTLNDGTFLHFWYANNKNRGDNNVTIIHSTEPRASVSAKQSGVLSMARTSGWSGKVNFSKRVQRELGV